jgi:hypothetical protein
VKVFLVIALLIPFMAQAQDEASTTPAPATPCSSAKHRQFDFWIGEWEVNSNGQAAGTNSVVLIHNGCALQENWQGTGPGGLSGTSFNIYDQANDKWHQTWVDSSGTLLQLDGALVDGNMVLSGQRPARDTGKMVIHRISWTPGGDGTVRQYWEASNDEGESWTVLFDGTYVKSSDAE